MTGGYEKLFLKMKIKIKLFSRLFSKNFKSIRHIENYLNLDNNLKKNYLKQIFLRINQSVYKSLF